jgi:hypothetical protein
MNFQLKQGANMHYNKFISSCKNNMKSSECVPGAGRSWLLNTDPEASCDPGH